MTARAALAVLTTLLVTVPTTADPVRYTADKWHTRIYFSVDHMGLSRYRGRFTEFDIDFMFDEEDISNSSVDVTIPVASIDTFNPELNQKMPSETFFNEAEYPAIHFSSSQIRQTGKNTAEMSGPLTIRGVTRLITFDVTYNKKVVHPRFKLANIGFSATGQVDSAAHRVNRLPDWMVGPIVEVQIEMEAFEGDEVPYYSE